MHDIINIRFIDDAAKWDEHAHPRGSGKKGGQFVRKGEGGTGAKSTRTAAFPTSVHGTEKPAGPTLAEEGKTPIGGFVASRLAHGDSPEEIAEKLKVITKLHKNPQYINKIFRQIEKKHGLKPGVLGKPSGEYSPPTSKPAKEKSAEPTASTAVQVGPKASQADIDALVASKKRSAEKAYHAAAWTGATAKFVQLAASVSPLYAVEHNTKKVSHFQPLNNTVNMNYADSASDQALSTWRHEFGHKLDWERGKQYGTKWGPWPINASYQFHATLEEEGKKLTRAYVTKKSALAEAMADITQGKLKKPQAKTAIWDKDKQQEVMKKAGLSQQELDDFAGGNELMPKARKAEILGAIHNGVLTGSITNCAHNDISSARLHDFYGPMTLNKMGWGHSKAYYKKGPYLRTAEAFANYVALTQGPHGKVYKTLLHATAPKLCAGFEKLLEF